MFARRIGNLPQAFSCVPRIAPIMEMDSCWAEVPGLANGKVQFVDVETLVMLCAVFLKYGRMEFCRVLLSAVFVDLYGITDRKAVRKMYEPTAIEMEPMIRKFKHFTSCCQCPCYKNVINEISYIWG